MERTSTRDRLTAVEQKQFLPVLLLYGKQINDDIILIGLAITRYHMQYYVNATAFGGQLSSANLDAFCEDCLKIASEKYDFNFTCVIANFFNFQCEEFFTYVETKSYIKTKHLYEIFEALKRGLFTMENALVEDPKAKLYRTRVSELKTLVIEGKVSLGEVLYRFIAMVNANILQINARWQDQLIQFINPVSVGCMYLNHLHKDKFEEDSLFFNKISDFVDVDDMLFIFKEKMLPLEVAQQFTLYKDCRGDFPRLFGKKFEDAGMFWNLCCKSYYDLGIFAYHMHKIPVILRTFDFERIYGLVQGVDDTYDSKIRLEYSISIILNK